MNRFSSYKENFILKKIVDRNLISISMYYTQRNFIIFSPILSLHILKIPHAMTRKRRSDISFVPSPLRFCLFSLSTTHFRFAVVALLFLHTDMRRSERASDLIRTSCFLVCFTMVFWLSKSLFAPRTERVKVRTIRQIEREEDLIRPAVL